MSRQPERRSRIELEPLVCPACAGAVPLIEAVTTQCPYCGGAVAIPPAHVEALRLQREEAAARRVVEPLWQRLARPRPRWLHWFAMALVIFLPPLVTLLANLIPYPPLSRSAILAFVSLPAVLPGAGLFVWVSAVDATVMGLREALGAAPPAQPSGPPGCRNCGAPLTIEPGAVAATCAYCGTDSLITTVPTVELTRGLRSAMRTLGQAVARLRMRRVMLGLGVCAVVAGLGGASVLIWTAVRATI